MDLNSARRLLVPVASGIVGSASLAALFFGIVSWAESPAHAWSQFQQQALFMVPILLGFGVQVGLYVTLRWRLFMPAGQMGTTTAMAGAGGGTSAAAMIACCAHHVTEVLPIVGLTAATAAMAQYQQALMLVGLATTVAGIAYMLRLLSREKRRLAVGATGAAATAPA